MYKICHTEASSLRQREMELQLLQAMRLQPYDKITLTELCRMIQVPRKTFYRYFPTKDDCLLSLIDHTLSDCNDLALRGWNGNSQLNRESVLHFFRYWLEHRDFLDVIKENQLRYLLLERTSVIVDRMKESGSKGSFARDQVEYFIAHGLMETVLRWHSCGFPAAPEEMAEALDPILDSPGVSITRLLL